jgi:hypothetical protein
MQIGLCQDFFGICLSTTEVQYFLVIVFALLLYFFSKERFLVPRLVYIFIVCSLLVSFYVLNREVGRSAKKNVVVHDLEDDSLGDYSSVLYRDLVLRLQSEKIKPARSRKVINRNYFHHDELAARPFGLDIYGNRWQLYVKDRDNQEFVSIGSWQEKQTLQPLWYQHLHGDDRLVFVEQLDLVALPFDPYEETLNFLQRYIVFQQHYSEQLDDAAETKLIDWAAVFGAWPSNHHRALPWFLMANLNFKRALLADVFDYRELNCAIRAYFQALSYLAGDRRTDIYHAITNNLGIALYYQYLLQQESKKALRKSLLALGWSKAALSQNLGRYAAVKNLNFHLLNATLRNDVVKGKPNKKSPAKKVR